MFVSDLYLPALTRVSPTVQFMFRIDTDVETSSSGRMH